MKDESLYWIWLSFIPGLELKKRNKLLEAAGSAKAVWNMPNKQMETFKFLSKDIVYSLCNTKLKEFAQNTLDEAYMHGIDVLTVNHSDYPEYLKHIHAPPIVLFKKGDISCTTPMIAVVGSRNASYYGLSTAKELSYQLSKIGIVIVSGMARGIDTFAHKGALNAGGATVAVMGCGLDICYPYENKKLMESIIRSGAVLSEYPLGMPPAKWRFPARNRIISGMSLGVMIVEASDRSGSLITANFALEQGREVFAVPGGINSPYSIGTNKLIRDGAKMVLGIEDILEELYMKINIEAAQKVKQVKKHYEGLSLEEAKLLEILQNDNQLCIDKLAQKSDLKINIVSSALTMLEMKGIIEQLPGKVFALVP